MDKHEQKNTTLRIDNAMHNEVTLISLHCITNQSGLLINFSLKQGCPTFSSRGPHLLNGISFWAAPNNSNYNDVQYTL